MSIRGWRLSISRYTEGTLCFVPCSSLQDVRERPVPYKLLYFHVAAALSRR